MVKTTFFKITLTNTTPELGNKKMIFMKTKHRPIRQYRVTGFLSGSGISSEIISAPSKRSARKKSKFN